VPKEKVSTMSRTTIDLSKSDTEHTNVEGETEGKEEWGIGLESPFIIKKRQKQSSMGQCMKQKYDKSVSAIPLVLMEGGPDEIGDVVCDTTKNILSHIEDQHHQTLDKVK